MSTTAKPQTQKGYLAFALRMGIVLWLIKSIESGPSGMRAYFTTYLPQIYGWGQEMVALPQTISSYVGIPVVFFGGLIIERTKNNKAVLVWTNAIFAISLLFQGITGNYAVYFTAYTIGQISVRVMMLALYDLVAKWFISTRGRVMGYITIPIVAILWTNIMTRCTEALGMTQTFWGAFICMAIVTILTALFVKGRPTDAGFAPDGVERTEEELKAMVVEDIENEWPLRRLVRNREARGLVLVQGITAFAMTGFVSFVIPAFMEQGYTIIEAANMMSFGPIIGIPISIAYGWLDDKIGNKIAYKVLIINFILMNGFMAAGIISDSRILGFVAMIMMGALIGGQPNFDQTTLAWVYGGKQFIFASKWIMAAKLILMAPAAWLYGVIYKQTQSYAGAMILGTVVCIVAFFLSFMIRTSYSGENKK